MNHCISLEWATVIGAASGLVVALLMVGLFMLIARLAMRSKARASAQEIQQAVQEFEDIMTAVTEWVETTTEVEYEFEGREET